jgi:hypothetical protein
MKRLVVLFGTLLAAAVAAGLAGPAAAAPPAQVEVTLDQGRATAVLGDRITLRATFTNKGSAPTDRLVADLNVASLTGVYVDLEDWSASRTHDLAPLAAGRSSALSWDIQAVNAGSFDVYIVVAPNGPSSAGTGPLVVSPPLHLTVQARRPLNAGGALPVVGIVPILLGAVVLATRFRFRRSN